jgi:hypothetical protein
MPYQAVPSKHVADPPDRLAGSMFVLDQAEANVAIAMFAKTDTG